MVQVPGATGPAKGRTGAKPARVDKAGAGQAEKDHAAKVVAVRTEAVAGAETPAPVSLHPRPHEGWLKMTRKEVIEMPGLNGAGPDFAGPMTGGAHGRCTDDGQLPGVGYGRGPGFGRGRGFRRGRGRGSWQGMGVGRFANRPASVPEPAAGSETLLQQLEQQAEVIQQRLDALNVRVASLKANATE